MRESLNPSWDKKLEKAYQLLEDGWLVWFRREGYRGKHKDVEPKWHIFLDRTMPNDADSRFKRVWVGLCGYQRTFDEYLLLMPPELRLSKTQPPLKDRCVKCVAAHNKRVEEDQ